MARKRTEEECQVIDSRILEQIEKHHPLTMVQLLAKTEMRIGLAGRRLAVLMDRDVVHRTQVGTGNGRYFMYRMGPNPNPDPAGQDGALEYTRPVRSSWQNIHRRDPLVAALFGFGPA